MTSGRDAAGRPEWESLLHTTGKRLRPAHFHLVGIGGSGLAPIGAVLLEQGYRVTGSDRLGNEATSELAARGATIYCGHAAGQIRGADLLLISSAVPDDNVEVQAARAAGIPVVKRSDFLGRLLAGRWAVGIAGSHGKTTTTAMLATVLLHSGRDPGYIVGGQFVAPLRGDGSQHKIAARAGSGPFVVEADEYDGMFLGLKLQMALITNVEWDHVDCYPTLDLLSDAFRRFVGQLPAGGHLLLCADDAGAESLRGSAPDSVTVVTYGLANGADWQARALTENQAGGFCAGVWHEGRLIANLGLAVPGRHNVCNAVGALAAAQILGVDPAHAAGALACFQGAGRRFEVIGTAGGIVVVDDYGHHPTEIAATLRAARDRYPGRRLWAVFQPHTYSRLRALLEGFARCFADADRVLLLDVFASREREDLGIDSRQLLAIMNHPAVEYVGEAGEALARLEDQVVPGDVVITLSAGDGNQVGHDLLQWLKERAAWRSPA